MKEIKQAVIGVGKAFNNLWVAIWYKTVIEMKTVKVQGELEYSVIQTTVHQLHRITGKQKQIKWKKCKANF